MGVLVKIDEDGRIALPSDARAALGLASGDIVEVVAERGGLFIRTPRLPVRAFIGILGYDGPPVSLREMDEGIARTVTEEDRRSRKRP